MCNAYNLDANMLAIVRAIVRAIDSQLRRQMALPPGVSPEASNMPIPRSVYPRKDGLILRPADPGDAGGALEPAVAHWNLTPFFHKGSLKDWKASCNNARSETMATSPTFREAFKRRRCVIPATSFTEWTGPAGKKTRHAISRADGDLLFLAGLWDRCMIDDQPVESYTMVMIAAGPGDFMGAFHNRQPVVLDADRADLWLDTAADPSAVLAPPAAGALVADPPEPAAA